MGCTVSFTLLTSEDVELALDHAMPLSHLDDLYDARRPEEPESYFDKAFPELEALISAQMTAEAGAPRYYRFDDVGLFFSFADEDDDDPEPGYTLWTPEILEAEAATLRAMPFDLLARHSGPTGRQDEIDNLNYLRHHYENLLRFLDFGVEAGSGAIMHVSC